LVESGVERRQTAYRLKFTQVIVVWASVAMAADKGPSDDGARFVMATVMVGRMADKAIQNENRRIS
jgi:hypothetical protein